MVGRPLPSTCEVRAVEFRASGVRSLIGEHAELGRELESRLLAVVSDRLQTARNRLVELYAYPPESNV